MQLTSSVFQHFILENKQHPVPINRCLLVKKKGNANNPFLQTASVKWLVVVAVYKIRRFSYMTSFL